MSKKAVCFFSSQERFFQTKIAIESFYKYNNINEIDCYMLFCSDDLKLPILNPPMYLNVIKYEECIINSKELIKKYGYIAGLARPLIINYVLSLGYEQVVCLDGDMEVFDSFDALYLNLQNYNAIVTPHITEPLPNDGLHPSMEDIRFAGNYNSAFFACSNTPEIRNFVNWWLVQSIERGELNPSIGRFADQGWLQFIADFVDKVLILRNTGYNAAYWRLHELDLRIVGNSLYTRDGPLVVYHYSGLDINNPEGISVHQNRYKPTGLLLDFLVDYIKRLKQQ